MLSYADFYDISEYGNENWQGNYNNKEVACNAYDYFTEFEYSKAKGGFHVASLIQELLYLLDEDGSEECEIWANEIRSELGLNQTIKTNNDVCRLINSLPKGTKITIELN